MSSSLAYYTLLSLAPLLVLAVSLVGIFLEEQAVRERIAARMSKRVGEEVGGVIEQVLLNVREPAESAAATTAGVFVLLVGATSVFGELTSAMNTIWSVTARSGRGLRGVLRDRFSSFLTLLVLSLLLLAVLLAGALVAMLGPLLESLLPGGQVLWLLLDLALSLVAVVFLFALSFKLLPDVRIPLREVWPGAALSAALFTCGEVAFGMYLHTFAVGSPYGAAGSLVVLVVWVYYFYQIMFYGAEFTKIRARARGISVLPKAHAERIVQVRSDGLTSRP